jgi:energy-coupling factor transporter ATP-binding protein EcfA2
MGEVKLDIKRFDIAKMKQSTVIMLLGRRGSGKSTLVRDILYQYRDLPAGCVINGTEEANKFYGDIVPGMLVKNEYRPEHLANLVTRQRAALDKAERDVQAGRPPSDPRAFLIMDDLMFDNTSWIKDPNMKRIFLNGRHYRITFMLTMQYPLGVPPSLRSQVDYTFILKEPSFGNKKRIYQNYASSFPSFDVFCRVLDKLTRNYGCLVIDNTRTDADFWDTVYWYRARTPPPFRMCDPALWRMDETRKKRGTEEDRDRQLEDLRRAPRVFVNQLLD